MSFVPLTTLPRFSSHAPAPRIEFSIGAALTRGFDRPTTVTCFRTKSARPWIGRTTDALISSRFQLQTAAQFADVSPAAWTVKGILPESGLGVIYGPPGAGKSFLLLDVACAIAEGRPWFGRSTRRAPVVYLCLEGSGGFAQRVKAWQHANGRPAPELLKIVPESLHLHHEEDVAELSRTVMAWVKSLPVGLARPVLIVDTLNRAMPGSDENGSADMGRSLQGCAELQRALGGLVVLVHHSGKDADRGPRGHTSLLAAADVSVLVGRNSKGRYWESKKVKDGSDDVQGAFELMQVPLGQDDDGDPVTSCVVQEDVARPPEKDAAHLSDSLKMALTTLSDSAGGARLESLAQVGLESWRELFYAACPAASSSGKRNAFDRARKVLKEAGFTTEDAQTVTITGEGLNQIKSLAGTDCSS